MNPLSEMPDPVELLQQISLLESERQHLRGLLGELLLENQQLRWKMQVAPEPGMD